MRIPIAIAAGTACGALSSALIYLAMQTLAPHAPIDVRIAMCAATAILTAAITARLCAQAKLP